MIARRGVVYLVGAGPGDPELMTIKGSRLLSEADVVVYDRLIPLQALDWCRSEALLIDVGKYPEHHRISQEEINDLLVKHAAAGKMVVRLKGGDPFVFGRGLEELEVCRQHAIPCFVVPGVSSSISAPAAAGIPVTSRGVARSFAVVTGQTDPRLGRYSFEFESLVKIDTIVLLMARKNLADITAGLIEAGLDPDTPAASIENATCTNQRVTAATVSTIAEVVESLNIVSPVVTVIGQVVSNVDDAITEDPQIRAALN